MVIPIIQTKKPEIPEINIPVGVPKINIPPVSPATPLTFPKFAAKTGTQLVSLFTEGLDFTTDLLVRNLDVFIASPTVSTMVRVTPWGKKIKKQWTDYFDEIHKSGTQYGAPILPTQKLQQASQKLSQIEYVQPSKEWADASITEKLSPEMIGETLFELGPSVVASVGAFAFAGPTIGVGIIGTATANDVKDSALSYGVDYDKAEALGLSVGIVVSALERIVPSKIFAGNLKIKNQFIGGFGSRLFRYS